MIYKGEVYLINLSSNEIMDEKSVRPCVIVQNDIGNRFSPTIIVATLTQRLKSPKLPTHVLLEKDKYGLDSDLIILMEQIRTISKARLLERITTLDESDLNKLNEAWCFSGGVNLNANFTQTEEDTRDFYEFFLNEKVHALEENLEYEFKSPRNSYDSEEIKNLVKDKIMEYVISFLNSNGGSLFFGIDNSGIVKGVNLSYEERDELALDINNSINNRVLPKISPAYYTITWHSVKSKDKNTIDNLYVLEIEIKRPFDPLAIYFDRGRVLYIKTSTGRQKLTEPHQMVSSIMKRVIENREYIESSIKSKN
ncbi:type II toxin-antitoxin system PemK/MazF family toxin [Bacillus cereus group sp. Bc200]|uniref:type II toxin-antitoxin system PemK/MazF family toxin n=1 Tax=Bacillus cereus group sp. Bc200 TaxID=3018112 RepID=UPI0022E498B7|nr:type II toxin-antitoxin system PemK/MazF family toxin [Bacillus cereus group sp. Bc200]MDA2261061.1 type II toxin-antitoxin system PemK/MazF family toxin [Bacillus cereus group sp. Bc200]